MAAQISPLALLPWNGGKLSEGPNGLSESLNSSLIYYVHICIWCVAYFQLVQLVVLGVVVPS